MTSLYIPLLGQVFLTFLVWFALVFYRVYVLQVRKIAPQVVADEAKNQEIYQSGRHLSDNFENLFEVPVLFYVGIFASIQLGVTDQTQVYLAWGFVGLRWAHSLVHLSINHISTRFGCYVLSTLFCLAIWVRIASHLGQS